MALSRKFLEEESAKVKVSLQALEEGTFVNKLVKDGVDAELAKLPPVKKKNNPIVD